MCSSFDAALHHSIAFYAHSSIFIPPSCCAAENICQIREFSSTAILPWDTPWICSHSPNVWSILKPLKVRILTYPDDWVTLNHAQVAEASTQCDPGTL